MGRVDLVLDVRASLVEERKEGGLNEDDRGSRVVDLMGKLLGRATTSAFGGPDRHS
jgi:hypothetical protein